MNFITQLQEVLGTIRVNTPFALSVIIVLWAAQIINKLLYYRLNYLGIWPRHLMGVPGIFLSPFLHDNFNHLFFNSIPLFVMICLVISNGYSTWLCVTLTIVLLSGVLIWLLGRRAIHIGASSLVMGYWSYLLVNAYRHPSIGSFILAIICLYYFGGLFYSLFSVDKKVSWEGHLFGFIAGIIAAVYC